jgi:hypothetical protein
MAETVSWPGAPFLKNSGKLVLTWCSWIDKWRETGSRPGVLYFKNGGTGELDLVLVLLIKKMAGNW